LPEGRSFALTWIPAKGVERMITVNGKKEPFPEGMSVGEYMSRRNINPGEYIVVLNDEVIKPEDWAETPIRDGDELQILVMLGGG